MTLPKKKKERKDGGYFKVHRSQILLGWWQSCQGKRTRWKNWTRKKGICQTI